MRFFLAIVLAGIAIFGVAQDPFGKPSNGKILPTSTKPMRLISELKVRVPHSVSEYTYDDDNKQKRRQRVFRYNWKGNYDEFLAMLRSKYVGKNGWNLREIKEDGTWEFYRDNKTGPVSMESYLVQSRRLIKDSKSPTGWVGRFTEPGPEGWIWISYNERYVK